MKKILIGWDDNGKWHTTLTVEGGKIIRIEPPSASGGSNGKIVTPTSAEVQRYSKQYAGDMLGAKIGQMTGRKPCRGCKKVEAGLNWAHKRLQKLRRRSA